MNLFETLESILHALRRPYITAPVIIPGLTTGAAYTSGDAFGKQFWFDGVPKRGVIRGVIFYDKDNEKLAKELVLSPEEFTPTTNDAAFAPLAAELPRLFAIRILAGNFDAYSANSIGYVTGVDLPYVAPGGKLWCQVVTRGADNIAAGSEPSVALVLL